MIAWIAWNFNSFFRVFLHPVISIYLYLYIYLYICISISIYIYIYIIYISCYTIYKMYIYIRYIRYVRYINTIKTVISHLQKSGFSFTANMFFTVIKDFVYRFLLWKACTMYGNKVDRLKGGH